MTCTSSCRRGEKSIGTSRRGRGGARAAQALALWPKVSGEPGACLTVPADFHITDALGPPGAVRALSGHFFMPQRWHHLHRRRPQRTPVMIHRACSARSSASRNHDHENAGEFPVWFRPCRQRCADRGSPQRDAKRASVSCVRESVSRSTTGRTGAAKSACEDRQVPTVRVGARVEQWAFRCATGEGE